MAIDAIVLHAADNVATAVQELKAGQKAEVRLEREMHQVAVQEDIPYGHKFAFRPIARGDESSNTAR